MEELGYINNGPEAVGALPVLPLEFDSMIQNTEQAGKNDTLEGPRKSKKNPIKSILFVDDEEPVRSLFKTALEKFGYTVTVASDGNEGVARFRENPADLVITDLFMPEKDGHVLISEILLEFPGTKIFAITGKMTIMGMETELDIARALGALRGYTKPVRLSEFLSDIKDL